MTVILLLQAIIRECSAPSGGGSWRGRYILTYMRLVWSRGDWHVRLLGIYIMMRAGGTRTFLSKFRSPSNGLSTSSTPYLPGRSLCTSGCFSMARRGGEHRLSQCRKTWLLLTGFCLPPETVSSRDRSCRGAWSRRSGPIAHMCGEKEQENDQWKSPCTSRQMAHFSHVPTIFSCALIIRIKAYLILRSIYRSCP
jgi:hypothetical protein